MRGVYSLFESCAYLITWPRSSNNNNLNRVYELLCSQFVTIAPKAPRAPHSGLGPPISTRSTPRIPSVASSSTDGNTPLETSSSNPLEMADQVIPGTQFTTAQQLELFQVQLATAKKELELKEALLRQALTGNNDPYSLLEENDPKGEQIPAVDTVCTKLPELPRAQVLHIYKNTFQPRNLCLLRLNYTLQDVASDTIDISGSSLHIKRALASPKDYGNSSAIWSKGFLNYSQVLASFHSQIHPNLLPKLLEFHSEVVELAGTYKWQEGVLQLALRWHEEVISRGVTSLDNWSIPPSWILRMLPAHLAIGFGGQVSSSSKLPYNSTICKNFNTNGKGCTFHGCQRQHICSTCQGDHPVFDHK
jgi:hypothetical protein